MKLYSLGGELAKNGINILDVKKDGDSISEILYEFRWFSGDRPIWTKSVLFCEGDARDGHSVMNDLIREVTLARASVEEDTDYEQ